MWSNTFFITQVSAIDSDGIKVGSAGISCLYRHLTNLTLNELWLERFGFEKNSYGWYKIKGIRKRGRWITRDRLSSDVAIELERPFLRFDELADIYYVHQLQNLYFALTGEELTIKETAQ